MPDNPSVSSLNFLIFKDLIVCVTLFQFSGLQGLEPSPTTTTKKHSNTYNPSTQEPSQEDYCELVASTGCIRESQTLSHVSSF